MKYLLLLIFLAKITSSIAQSPQSYRSFQGDLLQLYSWQGNKTMLLSSTDKLNSVSMNKWVLKMDTAYNYYAVCTGKQPAVTGGTYINNRSTIAEVIATCGAGCGYLGFTGIEMQTTYFSNMYNYINNQNLYDQVPFYELGRNFWFYDNQLKYHTNDEIVTGYAVFMRFMAMEAANVQGAPFNTWTFSQFKSNVINLLPSYMADTTLNWGNTLGIGKGVPNSNLGATDLFASFCFYLRDNYCGNYWVENVWKYAGLRPSAINTQDAVDNFIIASSQAANTNLTQLFKNWKWPISNKAIGYLSSLNLGQITSQPYSASVHVGSNAQFYISSSAKNVTYQWQVNFGTGFQNINNSNQYNGVNTNSLSVLDVKSVNNNNLFRCIIFIGNCADISASASLLVQSSTGLNNLATNDKEINIFPNPTSGLIAFSATTNVLLTNAVGQIIVNKKNINSLNISDQAAGIYFLSLTNNLGLELKRSKLVKEK